MDIFLQQLINGLTLGSVYALVALGYTMVYGIIGLINFAHGEVVMIGAMVAFTGLSRLTENVAATAFTLPLVTGTASVCLVAPGTNVSISETGTKWEPAIALPLVVTQSTVMV